MRKKRVLWVGEFTALSTGYSTYGLELLRRMHDSGKYELMELACYAEPGDPRLDDLPWPCRPVMPHRDDKQGKAIYDSNPANQFGEWKFDEVALEFRPDAVLEIRDHWMCSFLERSPFRPYFHWLHMPTVDAEPQEKGWLSTYTGCDSVFTYSDWGADLLRRQGGDAIPILGSAPPGADLDTFQMVKDRAGHRDRMGLTPDIFVVGTVMRNQKRKLYPDLFDAFRLFLDTAPPDLAARTYLHVHACWPDIGWDFPSLLLETGLSSRCLFTYFCTKCAAVYPAFFQEARSVCKKCGQHAAILPHSGAGISRQAMAAIYNLWDVFVQYSVAEGFGMPQVEAAACGVPVFSVDYSAMSDVVRKLRGYPIAVQRFMREAETHRRMALPDNADFVRQLQTFLLMPEPLRRKKGWEARRGVETHYNWDHTAQKWMDRIDQLDLPPHEQTWLSPVRVHEPVLDVPQGLSDDQFVRWGLVHVANRPDLLRSYLALQMVRDLQRGVTVDGNALPIGIRPRNRKFTREHAMAAFVDLCERRNRWEKRRGEVIRR